LPLIGRTLPENQLFNLEHFVIAQSQDQLYLLLLIPSRC
jgi:hypothetical protein